MLEVLISYKTYVAGHMTPAIDIIVFFCVQDCCVISLPWGITCTYKPTGFFHFKSFMGHVRAWYHSSDLLRSANESDCQGDSGLYQFLSLLSCRGIQFGPAKIC